MSSLFVDTVTEDQTGTTLRALAHGAVAAVLASAGVASLVALGGSSAAAFDPAVVFRALSTQVGDATPGGDVTTPGTAVLPAAVVALAAARFVAHAGGDAVPGDDDDPWVAGAAGLLVAPGYLLVLAAGVLFVSPPVTTAGAAVTALGTGVAAATGGVAGRVARRGQPVARAAAAGALVSFAATALSVARFLGATAGLSSPEQQLGPYAPAWVAGSWSVLSEYGYAVTSTTSFESLGAVGVYTAPPGGTVVLLGVAAFFAGALLAAGRDTVSAPVVGAGIAAGALATTALLTSLAVYSNGVRIWMAFDVLLVLVVALVGALGAGGAFAGPRFAALPGLVRDPPTRAELAARLQASGVPSTRGELASGPTAIVRAVGRVRPRALAADAARFVAGTPADRLSLAGLAVAGAYVFAWNVGGPPLASFDEGIYASAAAGMLRYGYWLVPHFYWPHGDAVAFEAFLEKPPLAFWVEAVSMAVFGVNEWGARLPNAAYSILTGVVVYLFGREVVDRRAGVLSAAVFFTTTFVYAGWNAGRSGGVEPPFVLFGTLSVFGLWLAARSPDRRARYLAVAATAAAAATLVKGFAFGLYGVVTLPLLFRDRRLLFSRAGVGAALGYAALVVPWPLAAWVLHGDRFVDQLWAEQVLGRVTGGFISYPATFEFMSYPYFRWLPTFLDPWFLPLLVVAPVALLAPWLSPQCPDLDAPFLVWWVVVVVAFFVPTGNHGWYLMPLYPAAAVLLGGWFAAASRGLSVPAATTLLATGLALALSPRFAGGRPWDTFAVQPRIPGEGLRSMAIPDGPLAVLALAGGAALLVAAPAVRAWLRARLGGRADTALPVLGMVVVVLVVGATAAPVGLQDGTWTPAEKEFGTAVDDTAPPDATLFMTAGAMDPLHGGFAFFFYTNRPLSVISPDQMSSDTVQYAMLTRAELDGVSREATVLARHADRPRSGQAFEDRPAVEVVVVRFEGG